MKSGITLMLGVMLAIGVLTVLFTPSSPTVSAVATEHTMRLAEGEQSPPATLEDVSWLVGSWTGEAFGSTFEEVWNPASNGSMVGFFKLMAGDQIQFYELLVLDEYQGSLVMKVKHFNADFTAWEEKQDYTSFKLVKVENDAVHFSGLSFYRQTNGDILGYIVMRKGGEVSEEKLTYRRRSL